MFVVALIGPDGSGKSTISKRLLLECPFPTRRIYMGINRDESNLMLPTTRFVTWLHTMLNKNAPQGGPRDSSEAPKPRSRNPVKRALQEVKSGLVLLNRIAEEWYRQAAAWYFVKRGKIVIFDRHFFADYYHYDIATRDRGWTSRIHGYMLQHLYPKPDLVIYLDAPAETLFARKGEGTVELLEERRKAYLALRDKVAQFAVVDANRSIEAVYTDVLNILLAFQQSQSVNHTQQPHV